MIHLGIRRLPVIALAIVLLQAAAAAGQTAPAVAGAEDELPAFEGPPAPVPPAAITRNAEGRATIRAVRVSEPMRIDGVLDEAHYEQVPGISDFIQIEPTTGQLATEKTEVWLAFDDDNVYVTFRNWDTQMDRLIATEMRRDNNTIFQGGDVVAFTFDTFFDRRNSLFFCANPLGGRMDGQVTNERQYQGDWNPVWETKEGRFDGGWTVEAAIPFKSLKYRPGKAPLWGFNAMRIKRSKNEISFLTRMPNSRGSSVIQQTSLGAVVVGMEVPADTRMIDLKPYVTSSLTTDRTARPQLSNDPGGDVGLDARIGVTENLVSDLTFNTDFAQVEADEQQINLTRFSLFFPEKREFFLESAGIFSFGGVPVSAANSAAPILFYSRRIGLHGGREVPLEAGGRLTGRVGRFSIGAVNIQTGGEPATSAPTTNFSVFRLKRDLLRSSGVGVIATHRSVAEGGAGSNTSFGVDGEWRAFENVLFYTYWAPATQDPTVWVAPFTNISGAETDRWIGAGLVETLTAGLSRVAGLGTVGPGAAAGAPEREVTESVGEDPALPIARRLGATWLISDGYQRVGDQIRITTRLVEVATGSVAQTGRIDDNRRAVRAAGPCRRLDGCSVPWRHDPAPTAGRQRRGPRRHAASFPRYPGPVAGSHAGRRRRRDPSVIPGPRAVPRRACWGSRTGNRRTVAPRATRDDRPRHGRPRNAARGPRLRAGAYRRRARRAGVSGRPAGVGIHPGRACRRRGSHGANRDLSAVRPRQHLRVRPLPRLGARVAVGGQRDAPRRHRARRARRHPARHVLRPP